MLATNNMRHIYLWLLCSMLGLFHSGCSSDNSESRDTSNDTTLAATGTGGLASDSDTVAGSGGTSAESANTAGTPTATGGDANTTGGTSSTSSTGNSGDGFISVDFSEYENTIDLGETLNAQLVACGMAASPGDLTFPLTGSGQICFWECLASSECPAFAAAFLSSSSCALSGDANELLDNCTSSCFGTIACGDGSEVSGLLGCDGSNDCSDGADEANCSDFTCSDGSGSTSAAGLCDGIQHCADLSDELDAAGCESFICANGTSIRPLWECDGIQDCADNSDEHADCEYFTCDDGTQVSQAMVCNLSVECPDASDELQGCLQLQCPAE